MTITCYSSYINPCIIVTFRFTIVLTFVNYVLLSLKSPFQGVSLKFYCIVFYNKTPAKQSNLDFFGLELTKPLSDVLLSLFEICVYYGIHH